MIKNTCEKCGDFLIHSEIECLKNQLTALQSQSKKSIESWKNSWFELREIVGRLSWQHFNCPLESIPETLSTPNWWDNMSEEFVRVDTRVYQRTQSEWKLIAQGSSVEAAKAAIRLFNEGRKEQ